MTSRPPSEFSLIEEEDANTRSPIPDRIVRNNPSLLFPKIKPRRDDEITEKFPFAEQPFAREENFEKNSDKQDSQRCSKKEYSKKGEATCFSYVLHSCVQLKIPIERINTIHFETTSEIIIFAFNALNNGVSIVHTMM